MGILEFCNKHNVDLSDKVFKLCNEGLERMKQGKDSLHVYDHITSLFDIVDDLIRSADEIDKKDIRFDVLLTAICWHDVWKASKEPKGKTSLFFGLVYEGRGSSKIFKRYALDNGLKRMFIEEICYTIRMHNTLGEQLFLKRKTIESKILWDIDWIYAYSPHAYQKMIDNTSGKKDKYGLMLLNNYKKRVQSKEIESFHFKWSEGVARNYRELFKKEISEI